MGPKRKLDSKRSSPGGAAGTGTGGRPRSAGRGNAASVGGGGNSNNSNNHGAGSSSSAVDANASIGGDNNNNNNLPVSAGYLVSCDVPTKQFILSLEKDSTFGMKNFVIQDLDATHLLVKRQARERIETRVKWWMDEVRTSCSVSLGGGRLFVFCIFGEARRGVVCC